MAIKRPRLDLVCDSCGKTWEDGEDITYVLNYSGPLADYASLGDKMPGAWSAHLCSIACVNKFASSPKAAPVARPLPDPIKSNGKLVSSYDFTSKPKDER